MTVRGRLGRARWAFAVAAIVLSACQPNRFVSGWVPYWGASNGRATISNAQVGPLLDDVSMLWYGINNDGTISNLGSASSLQTTVDVARAQGLPVIPTIFDSTAAGVMSGILADPVARGAHIQHIVDLVVAKGYDGIDLDYEVFAFGNTRAQWPDITPNWVTFVHNLSVQLHARGKLLSVTVPPVWTNGPHLVGYTVYAQDQIAADVDRLRLMVYDWSVSVPGPISPMFWVNSVISYSSSRVAPSKLQLGIPAYGRHWATQKYATEICPDGAITRGSLDMKNYAALANAHHVTPVRDASGELTFGWTEVVSGPRTRPIQPPVIDPPAVTIPSATAPADPGGLKPALRLAPPSTPVTCTLQHTVFVPDATSIRQRADAAVAADWSGIIIWAFGYETADVYQHLAGVGLQRPGGAVVATLAAPVVEGSRVHVTGTALHPDFDLPVPVRLTATPVGVGTTVVHTVVARTSVANMPDGVGPFHGIDDTFSLPPGTYNLCGTMLLWGGAIVTNMGCSQVTVTLAL